MINPASLINQTSGDTEYYTPGFLIEAAREVMGTPESLSMSGIDLDPASSLKANQFVKATKIFTIEDDGLSQPWYGNVWLNHPFGRKTNGPWISKLIKSYAEEEILQFCCITFASTSEKWFQPLLPFQQCFLSPRTNYYLPDGTLKRGVTKGSVITYGGHKIAKFREVFSKYGYVK